MELTHDAYEQLAFDDGCYINMSVSSSADTFPLHWHNAAEIIMPTNGNYLVNIGSASYDLKATDILFVSIGELHEMPASCEGTRMILQFDFSLLTNLKDFSTSNTLLQSIKKINHESDPDIHDAIVKLMYEIQDEYQHRCPFSNAAMYAKLLQIYILIGRKYMNLTHLFPDITSGKQQEYIVKFNQVLNYIHTNYHRDLTLDALSDYAGFSKFHFSRLFKQFTNMSLNDYINQKRISVAESLLINPHLSVTEVALQSGFNSLSTFNRVFKNAKNCTPMAFKNLYVSH